MTAPVEPIPSASVILLRDGGCGLEVFMIRRAAGLHFAAGATVFPGGRLDPEDGAAGEPLRAAAVRETVEECGIRLDAGALVPFARWITPETVWRRFDTTFFLAPAPAGQEPVVDGGEAVAGLWGRPPAILEEAEAGRLSLVFATRMNLLRLAACATVAEVLDAARRHQPLVPILPRLAAGASGPVLRIPDGAGYVPTEVAADAVRLG